MSIQIGKFLPKHKKVTSDLPQMDGNLIYHQALTEASKVEIGLDEDKLVEFLRVRGVAVYRTDGYGFDSSEEQMQKLVSEIATESELIVRKEGR